MCDRYVLGRLFKRIRSLERSCRKNAKIQKERDSLMTRPHELAQLLVTRGVASRDEIHGCSNKDIAELESRYQLKLPAAYKEFLSVLGQGAGRLLADCSWRFPDLNHANSVLQDKLQSDLAAFELPKSVFAFLECSAAEILFFNTMDGDDPPVYLIELISEPPRIWANSFSEWITKAAEEASRMRSN